MGNQTITLRTESDTVEKISNIAEAMDRSRNCVIRAWGGLHSHRGSMDNLCVENEEKGRQQLEELKRERERRGYAVVRSPGTGAGQGTMGAVA